MGRFLGVACLLLTACGRFGFDQSSAGDDDPPPPTPDAPEVTPLLACNTPARFTLGAAGVSTMTTTGTPGGFAAFTVDMTGNLAGWRYAFDAAGTLATTAQNVSLGGDFADTVGAVALGDEILVAAVAGRVAPTGTRVFPLDGALAARGPAQTYAELAGTTPLATAAGEIVFVASQPTLQVEARRLSTLGQIMGAPGVVADASRRAGDVGIAPSAGAWIATWVGAMGSPNTLEAAILDGSLTVTAGPYSGNPTPDHDVARPRVAWAKDAGVYVAVWYAKNDTNDDDVWIQLFDSSLAMIGPPTIIASSSYAPSVASDGAAFWLVWANYALGTLETVRLAPDGTLSARAPVATTGGTPGQWSLVERAGQVVLVWTEVGGNGPDLSLTALCP